MLAEEALGELEVGGELVLLTEEGVNPIGIAGAMTVRGVVHDLTGADTLVTVDLPEDNGSVAGGTEVVEVADRLETGIVVEGLTEPLAEG